MKLEGNRSIASSSARQFPIFPRYDCGNQKLVQPCLGIRMFVNRRKSERRVCRSVAKIQIGTGSLPRDCMITDISAGGVKVIAEYLEVPPEFTIIFSTGSPRQCRLAWRIGHEFGAQFID